jgi:hypothetical protein
MGGILLMAFSLCGPTELILEETGVFCHQCRFGTLVVFEEAQSAEEAV